MNEYDEMDPGGMEISLPVVAADSSMAIGTPIGPQESARNVTVYAQSISPISYGDDDPIVSFDIVFSVGVATEGSTKTYQIVKRIGIDRMKIASDAAATTPVSIVEARKPLKENAPHSTARYLKLAGL